MINAINALLECFVTALFTAALLVGCTRLGWFPVIIMQVMSPEEAIEAAKQQEEEYDDFDG
jgi:hypothetical protein